MKDNVFLDTNILVYLYSKTEITKRDVCLSLFNKYICITSTQALNEFCNVCIKKYKIGSETVHSFINTIASVCNIKTITTKIIYDALQLNKEFGYSYYDSLMLASALDSQSKILFSEDMQNGQMINGRFVIRNPFK